MKKFVCDFTFMDGVHRFFVVTGEGDAGSMRPPIMGSAKGELHVGIDGNWSETVACLLHELMEYGITANRLSYAPVNNWCKNSSSRLFVLDHQRFTEIALRTGDVMAFLLPKLSHEYNRRHKKEKR